MKCTIEDCEHEAVARGWCTKHYARWQRHGDPLITMRQSPTTKADAKICPRCANMKPIGEFGVRPNGTPRGYCKECEANYQAVHAQSPDGREMRRVARAKWNEDNHGYFLQYRYGITIDDYAAMLKAQGGKCAICGEAKPKGKGTVLAVDHCHATNKVRGLLCGPCNRGLGQFKDDVVRLRKAVAYLEREG